MNHAKQPVSRLAFGIGVAGLAAVLALALGSRQEPANILELRAEVARMRSLVEKPQVVVREVRTMHVPGPSAAETPSPIPVDESEEEAEQDARVVREEAELRRVV